MSFAEPYHLRHISIIEDGDDARDDDDDDDDSDDDDGHHPTEVTTNVAAGIDKDSGRLFFYATTTITNGTHMRALRSDWNIPKKYLKALKDQHLHAGSSDDESSKLSEDDIPMRHLKALKDQRLHDGSSDDESSKLSNELSDDDHNSNRDRRRKDDGRESTNNRKERESDHPDVDENDNRGATEAQTPQSKRAKVTPTPRRSTRNMKKKSKENH